MESKIEMTLTDMGEVLLNYYPPSHARLYPLKRLNIEVPLVHHILRRKDLTSDDKEKLKNLLQDLQRYINHYGVGVFEKYYINLWQKNVIEILNGA